VITEKKSNFVEKKFNIMKLIYLSIFVFCSSFIHSQSALNILDFYHDSFSDRNAKIITANARVGDYNYHSNIGGISFQAVASPVRSIDERDISLDFANNELIVKIGNKAYYPNLPYWQLAPIVNFTNSSYTVAFSQSGDTIGNKEAQCKFHPAFLDNLLGLRLFQADLLNLTDILWDIPIDAQRRYLLALSELGFKPTRDPVIHKTLFEKLEAGNFTSFILTDKDVNILFDINESGPVFFGKPYYYFVKMSVDTANIRLIRSQVMNYYKDIETHAKILLKNQYTSDLNPQTNLKGLRDVLEKNKQEGIFNPYSMHFIEDAISKLESLNKMTDAEIGIQFIVLDDYSESFKPYWDLLKKFNPLVYSAVENTAHWSAFFRFVKKVNPNNWSLFVRKVENYGDWDAPNIITPTSTEINYFRFFEERDMRK